MIKQILVSGFKTLSDFEMELRPGLNILVGPNGSGKTNIISFFEFLGLLQSMSVADAISSAGGAGSIFRKNGEDTYESNIYAKITGSTKLGYRSYLFYRYEFNIRIPDSGESITYSHQKLILKNRTVDSIDEKHIKEWDLDIESYLDKDLGLKTRINHYNSKDKNLMSGYLSRKVSYKTAKSRIRQALRHYATPDESIIDVIRFISRVYWYPLFLELKGGYVYNIEPSKAKTPDDSAKKPGVSKDGTGLYSTLYALKRIAEIGKRPARLHLYSFLDFDGDVSENTMSDILKYTRLANQWISKIDVLNNPFDKQLQIRVYIAGAKQTPVLPLSAMSDGTVKWIALITIILTNRTMFSLEEPENYLHPHMLSEIMLIMRSHMGKNGFILMSTHSETLINNATPDEIVVVSYGNGKTVAKRVSNEKQLSREIKDTGFGLGYYYISGSIEHE